LDVKASFFLSVYFQFSCKGFQEKKRFINVLAKDAEPLGLETSILRPKILFKRIMVGGSYMRAPLLGAIESKLG
jgi:hypothetical protein